LWICCDVLRFAMQRICRWHWQGAIHHRFPLPKGRWLHSFVFLLHCCSIESSACDILHWERSFGGWEAWLVVLLCSAGWRNEALSIWWGILMLRALFSNTLCEHSWLLSSISQFHHYLRKLSWKFSVSVQPSPCFSAVYSLLWNNRHLI
jgi:hypothetical protein